MDTTAKDLERLADRIAADLFTDGSGDVADRLVAVQESRGRNIRNLGGWSQRPARERILAELKRHFGMSEPDINAAAAPPRNPAAAPAPQPTPPVAPAPVVARPASPASRATARRSRSRR